MDHVREIEERGFPEIMKRNPEFEKVIQRVEQAIAERNANHPNLEARAGVGLESQCGLVPCPTFDEASQFVDVRDGTEHEYVAPLSTDKRGPCPGLNSAANHGFLPHNGIPTITQTIDGLGTAFGMTADLSGFLAVYATVFNGDPGALTWSIGGSYAPSLLSGLLGGEPGGISNLHNNYEADSSVTRFDAYLNNGDAYSLNLTSFKRMLSNHDAQNLYTIDSLQTQAIQARRDSIENNPYFFSSPFAGVAVSPVAHYFIVRMMSNHTAENPDGYLDAPMLMTHFGVTGEGDDLVWTPGTEKIPQNWYRRPLLNGYTIPGALADIAGGGLKYPELLVIGGNTGTPNSFTGIDITNLTGGVYNAQSLTDPNTLGCFLLKSIQIGAPDILSGLFYYDTNGPAQWRDWTSTRQIDVPDSVDYGSWFIRIIPWLFLPTSDSQQTSFI